MRHKKAIVSGATSFIGIALIARLISEGYQVAALVRPDSQGLKNIGPHPMLTIVEARLGELGELRMEGFEIAETFFHVGWSSDFPNSRYNLEGQMGNLEHTLQAVELSKHHACNTFLGVGSQAECGRVTSPISALTGENPENAYGRVKCLAAAQSQVLCEKYGSKHVWPRLLSAYGPYDRSHTVCMTDRTL